MAEIGNTTVFSQTDANNNSGTVPTFAENMAPSQVNDSARAFQGAVTREWNWRNATLTSTGSLNAYVLTYAVTPAALYNGQRFCFITNFANTGSATLNINTLGAKTIKKIVAGIKTALASGDVASGDFLDVAYNTSDDSFILLNLDGDTVVLGGANAFTGNNTHAGTETFNNDAEFNDAVYVDAEFALRGDITPAQITASQNDYAPTGHATASVIRLNTNAADYSITGLAGGTDGRKVEIHNTGSFHFFLEEESASSSAANRFATQSAGWAQIFPGSIAYLTYDATSSRWRAAMGAGIRAPQSVMEAATSESQQVTPGRQQNHPGHPKFWAYVTVSAGTPTVQTSYNVTSITDSGVGILTVTIDTDFSSVNWCCQVSTTRAGTGTTEGDERQANIRSATQAAGSVALQSSNNAGLVDPAAWHVGGSGDQ